MEKKSRIKVRTIHALNRTRCFIAIIACGALCVCVFLAVIYNLLAEPDELVKEVGRKTFRMFTVLSNLLMAVSSAMCIPFAVDGLRKGNYHLPRWIVNLIYTGSTAVSLTFVIAITVLSYNAGFKYIMIERANIYLHTICPLAAIAIFLFINSDHRIHIKDTVFAILPVAAYATIYFVMVFMLGEDAGGWRDHYQFKTVAPLYITAPAILLLAVVLAILLRLGHNAVHKRRKLKVEHYYQTTPELDLPTIGESISALARYDKKHDKGGDVNVPRRIIKMLEKKYESGLPMDELCNIYVSEYLRTQPSQSEHGSSQTCN